jgi:hypothetical protein
MRDPLELKKDETAAIEIKRVLGRRQKKDETPLVEKYLRQIERVLGRRQSLAKTTNTID